jgi:hypothetical protein
MTASTSFLLLTVLRNLRAGRRTAALMMLGFAAGWLLPAAMLAAGRYQQLVLEAGMMPDARRIIRLEEHPSPEPADARTGDRPSAAELYDRLRGLDPSVESVSRRSVYAGVLHDGGGWRHALIQSVDPSYIGLFRAYIRRGGASDGGRTCIAGIRPALDWWGGSGIGREIRVGADGCTVTGETEVDDRHLTVVEEDGTFRGWTQLFVKVKESGDVDGILEKIRLAAGEDWRVERMDEAQRRERTQLMEVYAFVIAVALIALLWSLLNIGSTMALLMRERRKKHGIGLAIGARPRIIRAEAFLELLAVSTVSLIAVFAVLKAARPVVTRYLFPVHPDPAVMLTVFALHLLVCAAAGFALTRRYRKPGIIIRLMREAD